MREVGEDEDWSLFWTDYSVALERCMDMKRYQVCIQKLNICSQAKYAVPRHSNSPDFSGSLLKIPAISQSPGFYPILPIFGKNWEAGKKLYGCTIDKPSNSAVT